MEPGPARSPRDVVLRALAVGRNAIEICSWSGRGPRRRSISRFLLIAACAVLTASGLGKLAPALLRPLAAPFAAAGWASSSCWRGRRRVPGVIRHFFQNPFDVLQRDGFVCGVLDEILPAAKAKARLTALEVEPDDGRYWPFLNGVDREWYLDEIFAVGSTIQDMDEGKLRNMKDTANGMRAKASFVAWNKVQWPFGVEKESVDFALISDGAFKRLSAKGRLEKALGELRKVLKSKGIICFVANEEDEKALGWQFVVPGIGEDSPWRDFGFEVRYARAGFGVTVGYMARIPGWSVLDKEVVRERRPPKGVKPAPPKTRRPRAY